MFDGALGAATVAVGTLVGSSGADFVGVIGDVFVGVVVVFESLGGLDMCKTCLSVFGDDHVFVRALLGVLAD